MTTTTTTHPSWRSVGHWSTSIFHRVNHQRELPGTVAASKKSSTSAPKNWWLQTGPTTPGQEQFNEDLMFGTVASGMFRGVFTGVCDDIRAVDMMPRGRFLAMAGYLIIFQAAKSQVSRFRGWRARDVAGIVVTRLDVLRKKKMQLLLDLPLLTTFWKWRTD